MDNKGPEANMTPEFERGVLAPLRGYLGSPNLKVPSWTRSGAEDVIPWQFQDDSESGQIRLSLPAHVLCGNFQADAPAAPSFALCLAAWMEQATGRPATVQVSIEGELPEQDVNQLLHLRRSMFLLAEYEALLGRRFKVIAAPSLRWCWPENPTFHVEGKRLNRKTPGNKEDQLVRRIVETISVRDQFSTDVCPVRPFQDKLPMGLFQHKVAASNAWTPRGASAVVVAAL